MASKLISFRVKHTGYLVGYFVLLLYTMSGLMFQGSIWLLAGALCWFGIVSRFSVSYFYRYYKNRSKEKAFEAECKKWKEEVKVQKKVNQF
jgi:hypothetical protein